MDDNQQEPTGGSTPDTQAASPEPATSSKDGFVKYESHAKLLGEKKKLAEKFDTTEKELTELKAKIELQEAKKLEEQGEFKTLLEQERETNASLSKELAERKDREKAGRKLRALLKNLNGEVDDKYWSHFDIDSVVIDPTSGEVDEMSVTKEVERFRKDHAILIKPIDGPDVSATHPKGGGCSITYDEWCKLPLKEMNERQGDVIK